MRNDNYEEYKPFTKEYPHPIEPIYCFSVLDNLKATCYLWSKDPSLIEVCENLKACITFLEAVIDNLTDDRLLYNDMDKRADDYTPFLDQ
jgi:hypothetical protein